MRRKKKNEKNEKSENYLKIAVAKELFPAPVLPTIPIFSRSEISRSKFLNTKGRRSLYLIEYFSNLMSPFDGQELGGIDPFSLVKPSAWNFEEREIEDMRTEQNETKEQRLTSISVA